MAGTLVTDSRAAIGRALYTRAAAAVGAVFYGVHLWYFPVLQLSTRLQAAGLPGQGEDFDANAAAAIATTLGGGHAELMLVERPVLRRVHRGQLVRPREGSGRTAGPVRRFAQSGQTRLPVRDATSMTTERAITGTEDQALPLADLGG